MLRCAFQEGVRACLLTPAGASAPSTRITYPGRVVGFLSTFAVNFAQQHEWSAQDMRSRRLLHGGPAMGIGTRESFWPSRVNLSACAYGRAYKINLIGIPSLRGVCHLLSNFWVGNHVMKQSQRKKHQGGSRGWNFWWDARRRVATE